MIDDLGDGTADSQRAVTRLAVAIFSVTLLLLLAVVIGMQEGSERRVLKDRLGAKAAAVELAIRRLNLFQEKSLYYFLELGESMQDCCGRAVRPRVRTAQVEIDGAVGAFAYGALEGRNMPDSQARTDLIKNACKALGNDCPECIDHAFELVVAGSGIDDIVRHREWFANALSYTPPATELALRYEVRRRMDSSSTVDEIQRDIRLAHTPEEAVTRLEARLARIEELGVSEAADPSVVTPALGLAMRREYALLLAAPLIAYLSLCLAAVWHRAAGTSGRAPSGFPCFGGRTNPRVHAVFRADFQAASRVAIWSLFLLLPMCLVGICLVSRFNVLEALLGEPDPPVLLEFVHLAGTPEPEPVRHGLRASNLAFRVADVVQLVSLAIWLTVASALLGRQSSRSAREVECARGLQLCAVVPIYGAFMCGLSYWFRADWFDGFVFTAIPGLVVWFMSTDYNSAFRQAIGLTFAAVLFPWFLSSTGCQPWEFLVLVF